MGCGSAIKSELVTALPGVEVEIPELGKVIVKGDEVDAEAAKKAFETAASNRFTATQL